MINLLLLYKSILKVFHKIINCRISTNHMRPNCLVPYSNAVNNLSSNLSNMAAMAAVASGAGAGNNSTSNTVTPGSRGSFSEYPW